MAHRCTYENAESTQTRTWPSQPTKDPITLSVVPDLQRKIRMPGETVDNVLK